MEEYFDVFDENGKLTGEKMLRSIVHQNGIWHKAVHIWVVNDKGELILQKRSHEKATNPDMWTTSTSGHLSAGDTPISGAIRELSEEIGLEVTEDELEYLFTVKEHTVHNNGALINNEIVDVFLISKNVNLEDLTLQKEEVSEVKYISLAEFEDMVNHDAEDLVPHKELHGKLLEILHDRYKI